MDLLLHSRTHTAIHLGTSIKFHGRLGGGGGTLQFRLDGKNADTPLNGTNFANGPTLVLPLIKWEVATTNLLSISNSSSRMGPVVVDYFECVAPLTPFCPKNYAPTTLLP